MLNCVIHDFKRSHVTRFIASDWLEAVCYAHTAYTEFLWVDSYTKKSLWSFRLGQNILWLNYTWLSRARVPPLAAHLPIAGGLDLLPKKLVRNNDWMSVDLPSPDSPRRGKKAIWKSTHEHMPMPWHSASCGWYPCSEPCLIGDQKHKCHKGAPLCWIHR